MVTRTEVATIIGILSFRTEGPETSCPCCRRCLGLRVVRVEMTGPFPVLQVIWYVISVGHGRLSDSKIWGVFWWGKKALDGASMADRLIISLKAGNPQGEPIAKPEI